MQDEQVKSAENHVFCLKDQNIQGVSISVIGELCVNSQSAVSQYAMSPVPLTTAKNKNMNNMATWGPKNGGALGKCPLCPCVKVALKSVQGEGNYYFQ